MALLILPERVSRPVTVDGLVLAEMSKVSTAPPLTRADKTEAEV
jgi:hypothetical protein